MAIQTCRRVYKSSTSASIRTFAQKSWVPTDANSLQKITTQALLHEVALQQMESAQVVVPWYLTNMPVSNLIRTLLLFDTESSCSVIVLHLFCTYSILILVLIKNNRRHTFDKQTCQQESSI